MSKKRSVEGLKVPIYGVEPANKKGFMTINFSLVASFARLILLRIVEGHFRKMGKAFWFLLSQSIDNSLDRFWEKHGLSRDRKRSHD